MDITQHMHGTHRSRTTPTQEWCVLGYDEELVRRLFLPSTQSSSDSSVGDGSGYVMPGVTADGRWHYLVVCPPFSEDERALLDMLHRAAQECRAEHHHHHNDDDDDDHGGGGRVDDDDDEGSTIMDHIMADTPDTEDSSGTSTWRSMFVAWAQRVVRRFRGPVSRSDGREVLRGLLLSVYRQLLGVSLLGEVSARTTARLLAVASELVAHMAAIRINSSSSGGTRAAFLDSRDFLSSVAGFYRPGQTATDTSHQQHGHQRLGQRLLSSSSLEQELERQHTEHFLRAYCDTPFRDPQLVAHLESLQAHIVVTQGKVARDMDSGSTTILGRGGSSATVAHLAAMVGAKWVEIWTHTHGLFTCQLPDSSSADPYHKARVLKRISYDEALEIAANNSDILSPTCIKVLQDSRIPMHVHSARLQGLVGEGTLVTERRRRRTGGRLDTGSTGVDDSPRVKCICLRKNITLVSVESLDMWRSVGFLADVFSAFKRHGISICHVATSETNVTCTLDTSSDELDSTTMGKLVRDLEELSCRVEVRGPCAGVSLVGHGIRAVLHKLGPVMKFFEEHQIHLLSQASSDVNLTFIIDEPQSEQLVHKLHDWIFGSRAVPDEVIGLEWQNIASRREEVNHVNNPSLWWRRKRTELLNLVQQEGTTPLYVYDEETLEQSARSMLQLVSEHKVLDGVFYAMKANSNPSILRLFESMGLGFECVSLGEVELVLRLFPNIDTKRILFTPNFAPRNEYERAFELDINVTLDNIYPLVHWAPVFQDRDIFCRIDPGQGMGHHRKVKTAGTNSKFGIPPSELDDLAARCAQINCRVVGLHAHVGSGILTETHAWANTANFLQQIRHRFPHATTFDLGGGLGVPQKPGDVPLDMEAVCQGIRIFRQAHPNVKLVMEPGRFLVATAGVLLTRVTQTKNKGERVYVGVDTGMNSLMRPALYGAYHEIVNLSRIDSGDDQDRHFIEADICGPICESGDVLGVGRRIERCVDGDVILVATAGAYGFCMSNDYNMRPRPREVLLRRKGNRNTEEE